MKRIYTGALALLMLWMLCACGKEGPATTEPAADPTEASAVAVTDGFSDTVEGYTFRIPQVNLNGAALEPANGQIYSELNLVLQDGVYRALEDGYSLYYVGMDYTWAQKEDVISLLVTMPLGMNDLVDYKAYCISLPTGELMSREALYTQFNATEEACMQRLCETLEYYWDEQLAQTSEEERQYVDQLREMTMQTEHLQTAVPFIGENGVLCYVVEIYAPAGAETYPYIVNLDDGVTPLQ